ncbi:MAG: DNA circularization protein [Methylophilus sp.]
MSWQDRLTRASFKGFEFLTESHEASYGRRLITHEYPKRDEPEVEDFGLKAKTWRLSAYFIGEDYDLEANGFLAKLNEAGADWLQHPWLGKLWVRAKDWSRAESNDKNGYCTITVDFVAGGRAPYEPVVDKVDLAIARIQRAHNAVIDDFDLAPMNSDAMTGLIADVQQHLEVIRKAISVATLPLSRANQVLSVIQGVKQDINVLLSIPQDYANALGSFSDLLGSDDSSELDLSTRTRLVARINSLVISPPAIDQSAIVSQSLRVNKANELALRQRLLITSAATLALINYDDAKARDQVLNGLLQAIDSQLNTMNDAVFDVFMEMRAAIIDALSQPIDVIERDVVQPLPVALLAYEMGITEASLISKNQVIHPLFVNGTIYG